MTRQRIKPWPGYLWFPWLVWWIWVTDFLKSSPDPDIKTLNGQSVLTHKYLESSLTTVWTLIQTVICNESREETEFRVSTDMKLAVKVMAVPVLVWGNLSSHIARTTLTWIYRALMRVWLISRVPKAYFQIALQTGFPLATSWTPAGLFTPAQWPLPSSAPSDHCIPSSSNQGLPCWL